MPDDEQDPQRDGIFTGYGVASALLGVLAVVAVALVAVLFVQHRGDTDELSYRTQVLQAAANWTGVLINMNKDTVDADLNTLHEGTVGQLNSDFEVTVEPYRKLVQTLQARTKGQVDSVALESIHHDQPGTKGAAPQPELASSAARTDAVMVIATSITENAGTATPQTVRWTLRMDVSDVDGKLLISRLEPIR